jgi:two-component system response regulator AtoC
MAPVEAQARSNTSANPAAPRVLVVEDDSLLRWAVAETLRHSGCEVAEGSSGSEAASLLNNAVEPFDVVLLDYRLPDIAGLSLLPAIRAISSATTVIVMTAFATAEMIRTAFSLGCEVISKPFDMQTVPVLVADATAR